MKNIEDYSIIIVMYHYVRQIKGSKYPNIKGLEFENFKKQINFFSKKFNIISHNDFLEIIKSNKIPKKPKLYAYAAKIKSVVSTGTNILSIFSAAKYCPNSPPLEISKRL